MSVTCDWHNIIEIIHYLSLMTDIAVTNDIEIVHCQSPMTDTEKLGYFTHFLSPMTDDWHDSHSAIEIVHCQSLNHVRHLNNKLRYLNRLSNFLYLLLSEISRLQIHRTPCIHDSNTWAPCCPNELLLRSNSISVVDSLHAKPSNKFLEWSRFNTKRYDQLFRHTLTLRVEVYRRPCLNILNSMYSWRTAWMTAVLPYFSCY